MTEFPDVRWGSESSPLRRPLIRFAGTRVGSWLVKTMTPLDRRILLRSNGRFTALGPVGAPVLLLTTVGARSKQERTTPLLYLRDGDGLIVVGSNFGGDRHPAWSANLLAHPAATVIMGGRRIPVTAELLTETDATSAYDGMITLAETYARYQARTSRDIRVFRLTAAGS